MQIKIIAHPNSKNPRIEKDIFDTIHVYVRQPAREGEATKAIANALAKHFKIPKSNILLLKGHKSKVKEFKIQQNN